jgi:hypothetical protein
MLRRLLSSKARKNVFGVLAVMVWIFAGVAVMAGFERVVTVPFCRDACTAAGDTPPPLAADAICR